MKRFFEHARVRRWPWLMLLIVLAILYYASYVRHGINFRDEGGTVALLSKRLLDGERPFIDVVLGYNVGWFYPVVGLFKLFGVNFVLLRAYCFALSTVTAVLAFLTVECASRRSWLAFLVALIAVLVPGMTFKNYMPLLAVSNAFCLLHFALGKRRRNEPGDLNDLPPPAGAVPALETNGPSWLWLSIGGIVLGLTFLIRIDVGTFCTLLWLGAIGIFSLRRAIPTSKRIGLLLGGPATLAALVVAVHTPVYLDAQRRGFAQQFVLPYAEWPKNIVHSVQERIGHAPQPVSLPNSIVTRPATPSPNALALPAGEKPQHIEKVTSINRDNLPRKKLSDFATARNHEERELIILLYLPLLTLVPLAIWALVGVISALRRGVSEEVDRTAAALLVIGAALTTFPQYFFFRPDSPHLSEFSPGFWVATIAATMLLGFPSRQRFTHPARLGAIALMTVLAAHAGLFLWRMMPDRWTGTIAARKGTSTMFHGENGVDVFLRKREYEQLKQLEELVHKHSPERSDFLVAYPYHPAINLLCDRRAYEKNLYVDNATREIGWNAAAIKRIQRFKPKVIVLSDWDINGTEDSRFSVWAEPTKTWIQQNYVDQGTYLEFEVFTRPGE